MSRQGATVQQSNLRDLLARAARDVDDGTLPSCQIAVAQHGELVAFDTFGEGTNDTSYVAFSCTKALIAGAVWRLIDDLGFDVSTPVRELVPELMAIGDPTRAEAMTVEQLLVHTSGFPNAPLPPSLWNDRAGRVRRFSDWRCESEPGSRCEYHATSSSWVLAEILQRVCGRDFREAVSSLVLEPLKLYSLRLGVPADAQATMRIADVAPFGDPPTADELEASLGIREMPVLEATDHAFREFNSVEAREAGVPGAGAVATAAAFALYYQALLHNPDRLWDPAVLRDATGRVRTTLPDSMTGVAANRTLGLVLAGDDGNSRYRQHLGDGVSARAFGHGGIGGQIAWADPVTGLSFCFLTNGLDGNVLREGRRAFGISTRAGRLCDPGI